MRRPATEILKPCAGRPNAWTGCGRTRSASMASSTSAFPPSVSCAVSSRNEVRLRFLGGLQPGGRRSRTPRERSDRSDRGSPAAAASGDRRSVARRRPFGCPETRAEWSGSRLAFTGCARRPPSPRRGRLGSQTSDAWRAHSRLTAPLPLFQPEASLVEAVPSADFLPHTISEISERMFEYSPVSRRLIKSTAPWQSGRWNQPARSCPG